MGTRIATGGRRAAPINQPASSHSTSDSSTRRTSYRQRQHHHKGNKKHRYDGDTEERKPTSAKDEPTTSSLNLSQQPTADDRIPQAQLDRLTKEILDQTKQLGFFDEVRMQLLNRIESSEEFVRLKDEFRRETERFCSRADLSQPRAKLRDQLQAETFANEQSRLSRRLKESIDRITYKYTEGEKLRPLYDQHATRFMHEKQYVIKQQQQQQQPSTNTTTTDNIDITRTHIASAEAEHQMASLLVQGQAVVETTTTTPNESQEQEHLSSSCCSSQADSGFSVTPPASCRHNKEPQLKPTETTQIRMQQDSPIISTAVVLEAIMATPSSTSPAEDQPEEEEANFLDEPALVGKVAVRYARRRERRIRRKNNLRRLKAQITALG